jgi:hypothetical protein
LVAYRVHCEPLVRCSHKIDKLSYKLQNIQHFVDFFFFLAQELTTTYCKS